jgi:hypothetical protein
MRAILIAAGVLSLAACSTAPKIDRVETAPKPGQVDAVSKIDRVEADIALACVVPTVRTRFPHVCADPARYAGYAIVAAEVYQAVRDAQR